MGNSIYLCIFHVHFMLCSSCWWRLPIYLKYIQNNTNLNPIYFNTPHRHCHARGIYIILVSIFRPSYPPLYTIFLWKKVCTEFFLHRLIEYRCSSQFSHKFLSHQYSLPRLLYTTAYTLVVYSNFDPLSSHHHQLQRFCTVCVCVVGLGVEEEENVIVNSIERKVAFKFETLTP